VILRTIHIDGFGVHRNRTIHTDAPFTIIYGPNEAGKSTLLHFIRAVLFGFARRGQTADRYEPAGGGIHGGYLLLEDERYGVVRVERYARRSSAGELLVTLEDGTTGGQELLHRLLPGLTGNMFRNLYAFGLEELQDIRNLQSDEVGRYLYSAGWGSEGRAVIAAEQKLSRRMDELFKSKGSTQEIARLTKKVEEMEQELRRSKEEIERYNQISEEMAKLNEELALAENARREAGRELERLNRCIQVLPDLRSVKEIERELDHLPVLPGFSEQAVSRMELLLHEREQWLRQEEQLRLRIESLNNQEKGLAEQKDFFVFDVSEHHEALLRLYEEAGSYKERELAVSELLKEREDLLGEAAKVLERIGGWTEAQLAGFPEDGAIREYVRNQRLAEAETARSLERLAAENDRLKREIADLESEWEEQRNRCMALRRRLSRCFPWSRTLTPERLTGLLAEARMLYRQWQDQRERLRIAGERLRERRRQAEWRQRELQAVLRKLLWVAGGVNAAVPAVIYAFGQPALSFICLAAFGGLSAYLYIQLRKVRSGSVDGNKRPAGRSVRYGARRKAARPNRIHGPESREDLEAETARLEEQLRELRGKLETLFLSVWDGRELAASTESGLTRHEAGVAADGFSAGFSGSEGGGAANSSFTACGPYLLSPEDSMAAMAATAEDTMAAMDAMAEDSMAAMAAMTAPQPGTNAEDDEAFAKAAEQWIGGWEMTLRQWEEETRHLNGQEELAAKLEEQLRRLRERGEYAAKLFAQTCARQTDIARGWQEWLREHGLPPGATAEEALELLQLIEHGRELLRRKEACEKKMDALSGRNERMRRQVAALLGPAAEADVPGALRQWKAAFDRRQKMLEEKVRLERQTAELQEELGRIREQLQGIDERLEELYRETGASGEEHLRLLASQYSRRRQLEEDLRRHRLAVKNASGPAGTGWLDRMLAEKSEADLHEERLRVQKAISELEQRTMELHGRRGRLAGELEKLESGADHADKLQRFAELTAELRQAAEQWLTLSLASALFHEARSVFEKDRQPRVLQQASTYFSHMTQGAYRRLAVPVGEKKVTAIRPDGSKADTSLLSRGTAEQLYLAMRLALVDEMADQIRFPLCMDDIFVNFDRERLCCTMDLLNEVCERRQILLFTCHPHLRDLIPELVDRCKVVEL